MSKNIDKASIYDECIRNGSKLDNEITNLRAQYMINMPEHIETLIKEKEKKMKYWENELKKLFY